MESLNPAYVPKVRKELLDADYLNQLSPEELKWYAQFMDEWAGGNVQKDKNGRIKPGQLHNTKKLAKDCYDRNNWRNNDVLGVSKANGLLSNLEYELDRNDGWYVNNEELQEDQIIHGLDQEETYLSFNEFLKLQDTLTKEVREFYEKLYADYLEDL